MSFYDNAKEIEGKIGKALADEGLVYTLHTKSYPATLVISQSQSPSAQMDFLANTEDGGVSSKDSALRFIFELDGIKIHTDNRLIITDAFMTKLKGLAKKWHTAYTHGYFADKIGQQCETSDAKTPAGKTEYSTPKEPVEDDAAADAPFSVDGDLYTADGADEPDEFADFFGDQDPSDTEE